MKPVYFEPKKVNIKDFRKVKRLTKGGFGVVYIIEEIKTNNQYAAKIIDCEDDEEKCKKIIEREVGIMMCSNHPTIIKFVGFSLLDFQGENNVTIIMELAKNGSLADVIKNIQENHGPGDYSNTTRQIILVGISRGMKYLHDRNIIHRDLKPGNVLLDDNFHPLITDFGFSKYFDTDHLCSQTLFGGTIPYQAPEILKELPYDTKIDVYAFGILMFEVISDNFSYPELQNGKMSDLEFRNKVVNDRYRPKFDFPISDSLRQLIEDCWSDDPKDRPSFDIIFNKLANEIFLDDVDVEELKLYVDDITEITDKIEQLLKKISDTESENQQLKNAIAEIKDENLHLKEQNKSCVKKISSKDEKIHKLKEDNDSYIKKISEMGDEIQRLKEENINLRKNVKDSSNNKTLCKKLSEHKKIFKLSFDDISLITNIEVDMNKIISIFDLKNFIALRFRTYEYKINITNFPSNPLDSIEPNYMFHVLLEKSLWTKKRFYFSCINPFIREKIEIDAGKCKNFDDLIKSELFQCDVKIEILNPPELPLIYIKDNEEFKIAITDIESIIKPKKTIIYTINENEFSSSLIINTNICHNAYDLEKQIKSDLCQYDLDIKIENPPILPLKYLKDRQEFKISIKNHYSYDYGEKKCKYSIKNCNFSSYIEVCTYKIQNEHDIIELIASDLQLNPCEYSIKIENIPSLPLKYIRNYYTFIVTLSTSKPTKYKTFCYELSNPSFQGKIEIDTNECTNKYNLEKQIADDLQMDSYSISIENPPKLPFKYLKNNHKFHIKTRDFLNTFSETSFRYFKFILKQNNSSYQIDLSSKNCSSADDLGNKIANELTINSSQIKIENPPKLPLKYIKYNNIFYFKILNVKDTIWFYFLHKNIFKVPKFRHMQYSKIFNYLNEELAKKDIYYFDVNFYLKLDDKELPHQEFPLIKVEDGSIVTIETGDSVSINYYGKKFNFKENEDVSKASEYIKKIFPLCLSINIQDEENFNLFLSDKIQKSKTYNLKVEISVNFKPFSPSNVTNQKLTLDYNATVLNAKNDLSIIFAKDEFMLDADDITLYDKNRKEINDPYQKLINIQNIKNYCFYFDFEYKNTKKINKKTNKSSSITKIKSLTPEKRVSRKPIKKMGKSSSITFEFEENYSENSEVNSSQSDDIEFDSISKSKPGKKGIKIKPKIPPIKSSETKKDDKSIPITFKFEESCGEIPSFTKVISISSTINELRKDIKKKYLEDKEIDIKYKESDIRITIDSEMTIEDVLEEIKEGGNILFIGIKPPKLISKKSYKPKITPVSNSK